MLVKGKGTGGRGKLGLTVLAKENMLVDEIGIMIKCLKTLE